MSSQIIGQAYNIGMSALIGFLVTSVTGSVFLGVPLAIVFSCIFVGSTARRIELYNREVLWLHKYL